jgi:DNA-binding NarL/FixJ family response regulator
LSHEEASSSSSSDSPLWSYSSGPLNLNRRGQILRLSRKGKSVAEIAQDLNVAQGEVELLLKVHDLSQETPRQEN